MNGRHALTKVPEITALFWIVKVLTTAVGESTSDFLVKVVSPVSAVGFGAVLFFIAMALQFSVKRYNAWVYWFAVAMVAIFGTMVADVLHIGFGVPYIVSTVFFAIALIIIFSLWYWVERSLSIHSIYTKRREAFYWLTIVTTFALGTAAGDMTASTLGLGYLASGILFAVLIVAVAVVHYVAKGIQNAEHWKRSRNEVIAFWAAYILTRPLGASFADWMGKPASIGGLGWGDGAVSLMLAVLIICFVAYLAFTRIDMRKS